MSNWYYVVGSDRVGPVSAAMIKQLFSDNEINLETYVWKKGFQNWERLKDVPELTETQTTSDSAQSNEAQSPDVTFNFSWEKVRENEEIFFIKIGKDRRDFTGASDIYGPYSLEEVKAALSEKRVNTQSLIFSPGMSGWTKILETPINGPFRNRGTTIGLNEVPLLLVFDHSPLPLVTAIRKTGVREGVLLGAGPFSDFEHKTVKASLYVGNDLKVKDVKVKIESYDKKTQSMNCQFVDLDQEAKKIMLSHAV